ncbi:MAG: TldD/PmbA family protein, partial [Chloroflexi bacterium]|nr:TldD/PmbA family protein [Chloroflexota bacterium]
MPDLETIGRELAQILKKQNADYIEAHLEENQFSNIAYRGKQLESIGKTISIGGNIRALVKGGWGFVSFNDLGNLQDKAALAVKQARFVGKEASQLAESKPIVETVKAGIAENPLLISLAEKKLLLDEYNNAIWSASGIQTSNIGYGDSHKKGIFLNSAGSFIIQERADVTLRAVAIAAKNGNVQQAGLSMGSRDDFSPIRKLHKDIKELAQKAVEMLSAPMINGGQYTVVLDPVLAGVFVHEAFGHLSESDFVYENKSLKEIMTLGKVFGGSQLNIIDSAAAPGLRGSYKYDDEGTPATKTYLIKNGILTGRLHSRETAAKMGEAPTGNARAISYRFP